MKKKVFFYNSGQRHNAYEHMIANSPEGFELIASQNMIFGEQKPTQAKQSSLIGKLMKRLQPRISPAYNLFRIYTNSPKIRPFNQEGYDLVHSCQSLLDTEYPWVVDFEHATAFSGFNQFAFYRSGFRNALKSRLLDSKLKKLISWSEAAKGSLLNFINDSQLKQKTETVYAVISPPKNNTKRSHAGINFLFIGKFFYEKGGLETVIAFDKISKKYDCTLTVVSPTPEKVKSQFKNNKKIFFMENIPWHSLEELYLTSDVLVFPTHFDTFGFVIAEAFSYGIPVISVDSFSTPELVTNNRNGLIVKSFYSSFLPNYAYRYNTSSELAKFRLEACMHPTEQYIESLSEKMVQLIEDGALRKALSKNAYSETIKGKFSPIVWKSKMKRIYEEALRR